MSSRWLGHPRGLATLFFTEMWERFSFAGMRSLLLLYMVGSVQQPGLGFGERRAATIYGLYTMAVFVSGIPGGWIADRWLGAYRSVLAGGVIIAIGHFTMAIPGGLPFFYAGLVFIVIGTGLLKPNVSTMVGSLYSAEDTRRDAGFSIFYMGINTGSFLAPLVCGWLGQKISWHLGFAAAGVGMLLGLAQYVAGRRHLVTAPPPTHVAAGSADESRVAQRLSAIAILTLFAILFWAAFEQAGTSLTLFADRATRLTVLGFEYPSSWFQSANPLFIILFSPAFAWLWLRLGRYEPTSVTKFTIGLALHGVAFAIILPAAFAHERTGLRVSPAWLLALYLVQAFGELCLSPVGLSLVTKLSPARLAGVMMGVWFFATGMGNYLAGYLAGFLEERTYSDIFTVVIVSMSACAFVLALIARPIRRLMGSVR